MRKFRFVGSEKEASEYKEPQPEVGYIYDERDNIGGKQAIYWVTTSSGVSKEWEEVFEEENASVISGSILHLMSQVLACDELSTKQKTVIIKELTE